MLLHGLACFLMAFTVTAKPTAEGAWKPPQTNREGNLIMVPASELRSPKEVEWQLPPDCGVRTLYIVLRLHDINVSADKLRQELPVTENGLSMLDLKRVAAEYGLHLDAVEVTPEELRELPLPLIAQLSRDDSNVGHFVTVVSFNEDTIGTTDGTVQGVIRADNGTFNQFFSGYVLGESPPFTFFWVKWVLKWIACIEAILFAVLVGVWVARHVKQRSSPSFR